MRRSLDSTKVRFHNEQLSTFSDATTGHLYLERPLKGFKNQSIDEIQLKINARDGKGLTSLTPVLISLSPNQITHSPTHFQATVHIYIQSRNEPECISFSQPQYEFQATEDILPGIILGVLRTQPNSVTRRLELISGDPNGQFRLDSRSGRFLVTKELDADHQNVYWLGVKVSGISWVEHSLQFTPPFRQPFSLRMDIRALITAR